MRGQTESWRLHCSFHCRIYISHSGTGFGVSLGLLVGATLLFLRSQAQARQKGAMLTPLSVTRTQHAHPPSHLLSPCSSAPLTRPDPTTMCPLSQTQLYNVTAQQTTACPPRTPALPSCSTQAAAQLIVDNDVWWLAHNGSC